MVVEKLPNLPVYRVKPENGGGVKTLHRDNLLPIGFLVRIPEVPERHCRPQRPSTRSTDVSRARCDVQHPTEEMEHEDDEESPQYYSRGVVPDAWLTCPPTVQLLSLANDRSDIVSERGPGGPTLSHHEEELLDQNVGLEENISGIILSSEDPVADTGIEGGNVPTSSESNDEVDPTSVPPASYDKPGEPTDKPLVIVHRGMRIYITRDTEYDSNVVSHPSCNVPVHRAAGCSWESWSNLSPPRELSDGGI